MSYTVAQNTSFLTIASVLQKAISFVYFTIVARLIGVSGTGVYFYAIAFTTIFIVVADFGLGPVLTREAARYPDQSEKYVNVVFTSKLIFGVFTYLLVFALANLLRYSDDLKNLIFISGITMFFDNIHSVFFSIFRARKNLVIESIGIVLAQLITLIIGTVALLLKAPLYWLILAYTIPSILLAIYAAITVVKTYPVHLKLTLDKVVLKMFLVMSLPFAGAAIINRLYSYGDSILMSKILSEKELGWWSVPYKVVYAFQFIPSALAASVYPALSSFYLTDKPRLVDLFVKSWRYLFIIAFPLAFGILAVADTVITKLYGAEFAPSAKALQVLIFALIFVSLNIIIGTVLNAANRQTWQTGLLFFALLINLTMNLILLPKIGIMGAATSSLISSVLLCIFGLILLSKFMVLPYGQLTRYAWNALWPAITMSVVVFYLISKLGIYVAIPIGVIIYVLLLFANKTFTKETLSMVLAKILPKRKIYE